MKGFQLIGAVITCSDCDFSERDIPKGPGWYYHATETAKKHHEETGHTVEVELIFSKVFEGQIE